MRNYFVSAAVLAALGAVAPVAANAQVAYHLNISGASAQRALWEGDMEAIATGKFGSTVDNGGATSCTLTKTTPALSPAVPDLHTLVCTISSNRFAGAKALPTGLNAGDSVTMYYGAEFGSVWGIAPFIPGSTASTRGRAVLDPASGGTVVGYSRDKDTATSGLLGPLPVDIGVSDNEPILWANPDNWAYSDGLSTAAPDGTGTNHVINVLAIPGQGQPTLAQLETLEKTWTLINGEVFTFVVEPTTAPTSAITNLSTQSLRAIFTGQYKTWSQVPEVAGAVPAIANTGASIVVCRRDHGSGSEVTTSKFLTLNECGGNNGINASGGSIGSPPRLVSLATNPAGSSFGSLDQTVGTVDGISSNPVENYSTNDIKACLAANKGVSIGLAVLGPSSSYTTLKIDGVEANAHNAAMGLYQFLAEDWGFNDTAATQGGVIATVAAQLFSDVQATSGVLPSENGTFGAGGVSWTAAGTASGQITNFYLQDGFNAQPTVSAAAEIGNPSVPTAVWTNTPKAACTILDNKNH